MFSAPALEETCRRLSPVDRLGVEPLRIELARGSTYALASLIVVATSGAGDLVPRVPILLEAEEITPGVLQLRSDDPDVDAARLRVIGTGRFRVRVRTACGGRPAEAVIAAESR